MDFTYVVERASQNKGKKIILDRDGDCLICVSHVPNKDGYIRLYAGKGRKPRCQFLHRIVWELENGPVPDGYEIDHKCKNRKCCNTSHLQILNKSEHKSKDNSIRYRDRILSVIEDIKQGYTTQYIKEKYNVPREYVYRYRRNLRKLNEQESENCR